ncbi:hypothetical protein OKA05_26405 [Luteolibacter arcticus]|uniref:HEAT repeat domain-containing protein n=1 Tax=Luteolibacter arcticus TaxID=1581411 RepID=A0ABT3GRF6_9BACT|nr:hypothetical protein [Luteolibacter arcticus]MCW1926119.1 hypothetical protein [Luteolibacter arcticus]
MKLVVPVSPGLHTRWLLALPPLAAAAALAILWLGKDAGPIERTPAQAQPSELDCIDREIERIGQVLRIPDVARRNRQEAVLAAEISSEDIPEILNRLSDSRRGSLYAQILAGRWAEADPVGAAAWIDTLPETKSRRHLIAAVAAGWAAHDAPAAIAWARHFTLPADREAALARLPRVLVSHHPLLALELADELDRADLTRECFRDWAHRDPASAARHALTIPASPERSSALLEISREWSKQAPLAAAEFAVEAMNGGEDADHLLLAVFSHAGVSDLPMLRQWIDRFPPDTLKDLSQAELTRIERLLPTSPANLPGEDEENRTPLAESHPETRKNQ